MEQYSLVVRNMELEKFITTPFSSLIEAGEVDIVEEGMEVPLGMKELVKVDGDQYRVSIDKAADMIMLGQDKDGAIFRQAAPLKDPMDISFKTAIIDAVVDQYKQLQSAGTHLDWQFLNYSSLANSVSFLQDYYVKEALDSNRTEAEIGWEGPNIFEKTEMVKFLVSENDKRLNFALERGDMAAFSKMVDAISKNPSIVSDEVHIELSGSHRDPYHSPLISHASPENRCLSGLNKIKEPEKLLSDFIKHPALKDNIEHCKNVFIKAVDHADINQVKELFLDSALRMSESRKPMRFNDKFFQNIQETMVGQDKVGSEEVTEMLRDHLQNEMKSNLSFMQNEASEFCKIATLVTGHALNYGLEGETLKDRELLDRVANVVSSLPKANELINLDQKFRPAWGDEALIISRSTSLNAPGREDLPYPNASMTEKTISNASEQLANGRLDFNADEVVVALRSPGSYYTDAKDFAGALSNYLKEGNEVDQGVMKMSAALISLQHIAPDFIQDNKEFLSRNREQILNDALKYSQTDTGDQLIMLGAFSRMNGKHSHLDRLEKVGAYEKGFYEAGLDLAGSIRQEGMQERFYEAGLDLASSISQELTLGQNQKPARLRI